jgi:type IV pilus assembly protein PilA
MKSRKGFTLVELMVVIMIVGILAAVAIPIMRGRIDSAKWSEGKSMMGSIATAIRAYVAERDAAPATGNFGTPSYANLLGFGAADLDGTYFKSSMFAVGTCTYDANLADQPLKFTITATNSGLQTSLRTLNSQGVFNPQ